MALLAWRAGINDCAFTPLYEMVDWPASQGTIANDPDFDAILSFASYLGDAINHGGPPLKGKSHVQAMAELEENVARLEAGEALSEYAQSFATAR